jgi:hypothetical protein
VIPSRIRAWAQLCQSISLSLTFTDQVALELGEGPHDTETIIIMAGGVAVAPTEGQTVGTARIPPTM